MAIAAIFDQEGHQISHGIHDWRINSPPPITPDLDEARMGQNRQMRRQIAGRYPCMLRELTGRDPLGPGPHDFAKHGQPGFVG